MFYCGKCVWAGAKPTFTNADLFCPWCATEVNNMSLGQWAEARREDFFAREGTNSLRTSRDKPLGGQGYPSFWAALKGIWANRKYLGGRGSDFVGTGAGYWLYVWHKDGLSEVIAKHESVLTKAGWPLERKAFVKRARDEMVCPMTPLYDVVADAYGDYLNPGRTDVFSDLTRQLLFDALDPTFMDSSEVYFRSSAADLAVMGHVPVEFGRGGLSEEGGGFLRIFNQVSRGLGDDETG